MIFFICSHKGKWFFWAGQSWPLSKVHHISKFHIQGSTILSDDILQRHLKLNFVQTQLTLWGKNGNWLVPDCAHRRCLTSTFKEQKWLQVAPNSKTSSEQIKCIFLRYYFRKKMAFLTQEWSELSVNMFPFRTFTIFLLFFDIPNWQHNRSPKLTIFQLHHTWVYIFWVPPSSPGLTWQVVLSVTPQTILWMPSTHTFNSILL